MRILLTLASFASQCRNHQGLLFDNNLNVKMLCDKACNITGIMKISDIQTTNTSSAHPEFLKQYTYLTLTR